MYALHQMRWVGDLRSGENCNIKSSKVSEVVLFRYRYGVEIFMVSAEACADITTQSNSVSW